MTPEQAEAIRAFYRHVAMIWNDLDRTGRLSRGQSDLFIATYKSACRVADLFPEVFPAHFCGDLMHAEPWFDGEYSEKKMFEAMK